MKIAVRDRLLAAEDRRLAAAPAARCDVDQSRCRVESIWKLERRERHVSRLLLQAKFRSIVPSEIPGVNRRARRRWTFYPIAMQRVASFAGFVTCRCSRPSKAVSRAGAAGATRALAGEDRLWPQPGKLDLP